MKSKVSVIILMILLQISVLSQSQNLKSFLEKHIVPENKDINVIDLMRNRNIGYGNKCKARNTFIHDTNGVKVKELCANVTENKEVISDECMPLTDAILQSNSPPPPNCIYDQRTLFGKIRIKCENKEPVHFAGFEECFEKHEKHKLFKEKHIVQNDEKLDCNIAMQKQNIKKGKDTKKCTKEHTYIHDTNGKKCTQLCSDVKDSTITVSETAFLLTHCILKTSSADAEECDYEQITESGKIQVICEDSYPVYYVKYHESSTSWSVYTYVFLFLILLISIIVLMNCPVGPNREARQIRDICRCR